MAGVFFLSIGDRICLAGQFIQTLNFIGPVQVFPTLKRNRDIAVLHQKVMEMTEIEIVFKVQPGVA